ncbi:MAG: hypothetical protein IJ728_04930 [Selenomonadaceae bacterium]|nr:hypothetical protein [Selenomonadaceae bacterium]
MILEKMKSEGGLSPKEMMKLGSSMSGQYALSAFMAMINSDDQDIKTLMEKVYNSHGTTQEMFDKMSQTLDFDIESFKSAFSDLQIEILSGNGGQGLREFFQSITEDVNQFKNSLKDGFDLGDIGNLLAKVATQLKDKFLAFDGVGSILAGGALVMGLKKIYDLTMKVKDAASTAKSWWQGANINGGNQSSKGSGGITQSISTMNVKAGVVNLNGKISNSATGTTSTTGGANRNSTSSTTGGVVNRNSTSTAGRTATSTLGKFGGVAKVLGGASLLTALFAGFDVFSTRSTNESRISEAQALREEYRKEYQKILEDPERRQELPQSTQNLNQATANLRAVQKEATQHNNESLFGGIGAVGGAATGALAGAAIGSFLPGIGTIAELVIGGLLANFGSEVGKDFGKDFDTDILSKFFGKDKSQQEIDFKLDNGKMLSELDYSGKVQALSNLSAAELERMNQATVDQKSAAEFAAAAPNLKSSNIHNRDKSREEIDAQIKKDEETKLAATKKSGEEVLKRNAEERKNLTTDQIRQVEQSNERRGLNKEGLSPEQIAEMNKKSSLAASETAIMEGTQKVEAFFQSVKDFFSGKVQEAEGGATNLGVSTDKSSGQKDHLGFEMPDFSQMWTNFNMSDFLPDIDISQWLTESVSNFEMPDLSSISTTLSESFNGISEMISNVTLSISEGFSQIPTAASEAFSTISYISCRK